MKEKCIICNCKIDLEKDSHFVDEGSIGEYWCLACAYEDAYKTEKDKNTKIAAEVERLQAENEKFTNSILHDTYSEFVHTAEIDKLKLENEKLKHLMEQMVSKKMYKIIIDFAEGRLKELPIELEDKE